jgi:hypothetical protein
MNDVKLPARGARWHPAETRIIEKAAKRLLAGYYARLSEGTEDCLLRLRRWYAALPGVPNSGRTYPRTLAAIREQLHKAAVARGYRVSPYLWAPRERRMAYKWTKRFLRHQKDHPPLARLDAGRGLLVELFLAGYDRELDGCTSELDKCRSDIAQGIPRHCGHGRAAIQLPPDVVRWTHRAAAPRKASTSGASKARTPRSRARPSS